MYSVKAGEVAQELRKLADALDKEPEILIPQAFMFLSCRYESNGREMFLNLARLMPRPLVKKQDGADLELTYRGDALSVKAYVEQSKVCTLKEPARPAVYECEPLLSQEEEATLTV